MSVAEIAGISREEAYEVAEAAYRLCLQGKKEEAIKILEGLLVLNPQDSYLKNFLDRVQYEYSQKRENDPRN